MGPQHDFGVSLGYSFAFADTTLETGFAVTGVPTTTHLWLLGVEYIPIDALAVRLDLEMYAGVYSGPQRGPNPQVVYAHGSFDDGSLHFTPTDASLEVAYMVLEHPVAIAPFIRAILPTNDYETSGYAAAGAGLMAAGFGVELGVAHVGTPGTFATARYMFMLVEREDRGGEVTSSVSLNRSQAQLYAGYDFTDVTDVPLSVALGGSLWLTHGGVQLIDTTATGTPLFTYHDVIRRQEYLTLGGSVGYVIDDTISVNIGFEQLIWGNNVAEASIIKAGVRWDGNVLDLLGE